MFRKSVQLCLLLILLKYCDGISDDEVKYSKRRERAVDDENLEIERSNNCQCVQNYLCDSNNYVITNGEGIIDVRFGEGSSKILCKGGLYPGEQVCCKVRDATSTTQRPQSRTDVTSDDSLQQSTVRPIRKKKNLVCGKQLPDIDIRILTGGDELTPMNGEFPWIAALFLKDNEGRYKFHCSGSLIHPKVVLTANHCVHRRQAGKLRVLVNGKINLYSIGENPELERSVEEVINHPDYYAGGVYNDIALLILDEPYNISGKVNHINTICLPSANQKLENVRCLVSGWGKDSPEDERVLKKVDVPTVPHSTCQDLMRQTRLGIRFNLHNSFMCAGGEEGKDACKGDGGAPLMCPKGDGNTYFQAGIVSWGIGCGMKDVPGVYADVSVFKDWIITELKNKNINI